VQVREELDAPVGARRRAPHRAERGADLVAHAADVHDEPAVRLLGDDSSSESTDHVVTRQ